MDIITCDDILDEYEEDARTALEWTQTRFASLKLRSELVHYFSMGFVALSLVLEGIPYVFNISSELLEYLSYAYIGCSGIALALKLYYIFERYPQRMSVITASEERFRSIMDSLERSKLGNNKSRRMSNDYLKRIGEKVHLTATIIANSEDKMFPRKYGGVFDKEESSSEEESSEIEMISSIDKMV